MINLAKNDCMGAFVYNDELFEYILAHGKPITEIPIERDENQPNTSPLIEICHVPTRKVNAYKSWYYFKDGNARIHTESGSIKPNNDDFMYVIYADDDSISKGKPVKIYDEKLYKGIGVYRNFIDEKTDKKFLKNRAKFNSNYTKEELESEWYKKFKELSI